MTALEYVLIFALGSIMLVFVFRQFGGALFLLMVEIATILQGD